MTDIVERLRGRLECSDYDGAYDDLRDALAEIERLRTQVDELLGERENP